MIEKVRELVEKAIVYYGKSIGCALGESEARKWLKYKDDKYEQWLKEGNIPDTFSVWCLKQALAELKQPEAENEKLKLENKKLAERIKELEKAINDNEEIYHQGNIELQLKRAAEKAAKSGTKSDLDKFLKLKKALKGEQHDKWSGQR